MNIFVASENNIMCIIALVLGLLELNTSKIYKTVSQTLVTGIIQAKGSLKRDCTVKATLFQPCTFYLLLRRLYSVKC